MTYINSPPNINFTPAFPDISPVSEEGGTASKYGADGATFPEEGTSSLNAARDPSNSK